MHRSLRCLWGAKQNQRKELLQCKHSEINLLSKLDGGGIFLLCQRSEGLTLSPPGIMHHDQRRAYPKPGQFLKMLLANTQFGRYLRKSVSTKPFPVKALDIW